MLDQLEAKLGRSARRLERLADDYKAIKHVEKTMLADAPKTIERTRQQRQEQEAQEKEAKRNQFKAATAEAFTTYAKRVPGFTDTAGGLTATAQAVLDKTSAIDPATLSSGDLAYMSFCANSFPAARAAIVKLEKENALLRAGKPIPAPLAGAPPAAAAPPVQEERQGGLLEAMAGKEFTFTGG
jgi:type IV secretory pathway VirB10-like protein